MLPVERKHKIKELIQERQAMKISELSKEIGVSEMTIHRDLKPLIEEGFVVKTFGGVTASQNEVKIENSSETCDYCHRTLNDRLAYRLFLQDNTMIAACCAHCGLLKHRQLKEQVTHAICRDLILQTTINAPASWFVMDTSIHIDCCKPQVLTFEYKEHATKFVTGFGGEVYAFHEAMEVVYNKMSSNHHSCEH